MDESMHLSGMRYLHETLRPPLERLLSERKPCEIDPARVKDSAVISHNLANLKVIYNYVIYTKLKWVYNYIFKFLTMDFCFKLNYFILGLCGRCI